MTGTIGRWQGAGLMATTLLGTGVFILPQMTIAVAGTGALAAWLILTIAIIPVALVFGLLSGRFAHAAGPAYFVEKAMGATAGRTIGLIFLLVIPIGAPAAILMTFQFMDAMWPMSGAEQLVAQLFIVLLLLLLNVRGIQVSAQLQFGLTLAIIAVVVALISVSAPEMVKVDVFQAQTFEYSGLMLAVGIGFWSFLGIEAMSHLATEFKQPKRDMLPAMVMGTVLVGVIYLLCTLLLLATPEAITGVAMMAAFDYWLAGTAFNGAGVYVIGILGIVSGLATVNVYAASAARLLWSFSQEGIMPRYFSTLNEHAVPQRALMMILATMAVVITLTYFSGQDLESLISWSNGVFVVIYLVTLLAAIKLLGKKALPIVICGSVFCVGVAIALGINMLYALVLVIIFVPFVGYQKKHLERKQAV